jgi:hypothetical protein
LNEIGRFSFAKVPLNDLKNGDFLRFPTSPRASV